MRMMTEIEYKQVQPVSQLSDFVESYWMLCNHAAEEKKITIVPDGRIDLSYALNKPYRTALLGPEDAASKALLAPGSILFAVSFKLLAVEYIFNNEFSSLLNAAYILPYGYLNITEKDANNFTGFCSKMNAQLVHLLKPNVDERKRNLFELVYSSNGAATVKELSETLNWSSRQINRYFNQQFGLSLKAYCNILRFRASFHQIKKGKLFPEQNFADQAHFIKDVKKYSGVTPKELSKNLNDRFIQFSLLLKS